MSSTPNSRSVAHDVAARMMNRFRRRTTMGDYTINPGMVAFCHPRCRDAYLGRA
jgi:hypothetical protein